MHLTGSHGLYEKKLLIVIYFGSVRPDCENVNGGTNEWSGGTCIKDYATGRWGGIPKMRSNASC